ncbi:MAG: alpha/beta hydrolase [Treponema sp.]|nr:alpha/beta hydrolase [Treponema sp.]
MKKTVFFLIVFFSLVSLFARERIFLWEDVAGMETNVRDTILYPSVVRREDGKKTAAVIICPGGSYHHLGMPHEGFASQKWFNSVGMSAFVLRYRVAYNRHHHPAMLEDIQMAIAYIRQHADEYNIDKEKIGAIGYSAGGHLVTMAGAFGATSELEKLGIHTEESVRPNFVMPIYPVVSMQDDIAHKRSRKSLLHRNQSEERKNQFSMELQIPDDMPPTFLLACHDDPVVIFENSVRLDAALTEKNIPHIFVQYENGGHGFGMKENSAIMKAQHWNDKKLLPWLREIGILSAQDVR